MEGGAGGCGAFLMGAGGVAMESSSSAAFDAADDDSVEVGRATGSAFPCKYLSIHCSRSAAAPPAEAADDEGAAADDDDNDNEDDDVVIVFARCTLRATASDAAPVTIPIQNLTICSSCRLRARSLSFIT